MAMPSQYDADRTDGSKIDCASGQEPSFVAQLRKTLNTIPAYTWYALPSGVLTFVNEAYADYLGLAKDDPLRLGVEVDVPWDSHIELVHPDDREETLKVGQPVTALGLPAKQPSEYEILKENTAGSSVASNLSVQVMGRCCTGSELISTLTIGSEPKKPCGVTSIFRQKHKDSVIPAASGGTFLRTSTSGPARLSVFLNSTLHPKSQCR